MAAALLYNADPRADDDGPFDWPTFGLIDDVRPALAQAMAAGEPAVLATLHAMKGGAPRGVGAQMVFTADGMAGFLSGGCIEADVAFHAQAALADGEPRRLVYGEGGPLDIRLPCGSRIDILLERIAPGDPAAARLVALTAARQPALWLTDGRRRVCLAETADTAHLPAGLRLAADRARGRGQSAELRTMPRGSEAEPVAVSRFYAPPLRLLVVGADPIALALVRLASTMQIETALVRPKGPPTPPPGLSAALYQRGAVRDALAVLAPDPWTAIAVLMHDADQELAALKAALATPAAYVGALGSRRRIPARNLRLQADGVAMTDTARIHAPIGLAGCGPIGFDPTSSARFSGRSPYEIAVAVMAEILAETRAVRSGEGESLAPGARAAG